MYRKTCEICGMDFAAQRKHTKYCSKACQMEKDRRRANAQYKIKKTQSNEKHVPKLDEINRKAREAGMSYGKYVAEMYKERLKNERTM